MNASPPTAVYIYARVSTAKQGNFGLSLAEQKDRCQRYATEKGWRVTEVVEEVGSAYRKHLKKLESLHERAIPGSTILVASYDRYSRNIINGATAIRELAKRKIRVFSLQEQQDTLTPVGRYTFAITVAAGEFQSANVGAKVAATFAKQKREGIEFGAAKYGQRVEKELGEDGKLRKRKRVVDDKEGTVIELMKGLRDGITAKRATALMNKVVPPADRAPVEFLMEVEEEVEGKRGRMIKVKKDKVVPQVVAGALNCTDIAGLLEEYNVPYRDGKRWTGEAVRRILTNQEREVNELGAAMAAGL